MKDLADWLAHLESLHPKGQHGIELGLERVTRVKAALRQEQRCPLIIVGGTNGKGSTCAYLETIYRSAGYRVGSYSSPHLLTYNERVKIDGAPVTDAALCAAFARVDAARQAAGDVPLTYFEFGTLAAWEVFAEHGMQAVILEVGLGGRLDAVNIYDADVAIVTGIALDHTDWLGDTRETIGFEKAGIFRTGRLAICADPQPPQSLRAHAESIGAGLRLIGRDFDYERVGDGWSFQERDGGCLDFLPMPAMRGEYQLGNASAALVAISALQESLPVATSSLACGLREAQVAGRFQQIHEKPTIILDVAHNPQAAAALAENLAAGSFRRTIAVAGMLIDKDIGGSLAALAGKIDLWLLASLDGPRGATAEALAEVISGYGDPAASNGQLECFAGPEAAFRRAVGLAGENDRIVAFGSFHTVAAVLRVYGQMFGATE